MKMNAVLPPEETDRLVALRGTDQFELYARVYALHLLNWPMRSVGDCLGISRTAVGKWIQQVRDGRADVRARSEVLLESGDVPSLPLRDRDIKSKRVYAQVPPDQAARLVELVPIIVRRRAQTVDPDVLGAVAEYQSIVEENYLRGVTPMDIARSSAVTRRAISTHLQKIDLRNREAAA